MWWSGFNTERVRDRIVGWGAYQRILNMQKELLVAGAKRAKLWLRYWSGVPCSCVKEGEPQSPHNICYGTGWVGGYERYGWKDWIVYRKADVLYGTLYDKVAGQDIVPQVIGTTHIIETDWIYASTLESCDALHDAKRRNIEVKYSTDGTVWNDTITFPVEKFKIRITGEADDIEIIRVRGKAGLDEVLLSETPPRRLEELLRWGRSPEVVDIRCWTINEPYLYTGDVVEWLEGGWAGQRYVVVEKRTSQFRISETESKTITQILGMRHIENYQQIGRIF